MTKFYLSNRLEDLKLNYPVSTLALTYLDLSNFDLSKRDMSYMFNRCMYIEHLILPTLSSNSLAYTFNGCMNLKYLDISYDIDNVDLSYTFQQCHSIESVNIPNIVSSYDGSFSGCYKLKQFGKFGDNVIVIGHSVDNGYSDYEIEIDVESVCDDYIKYDNVDNNVNIDSIDCNDIDNTNNNNIDAIDCNNTNNNNIDDINDKIDCNDIDNNENVDNIDNNINITNTNTTTNSTSPSLNLTFSSCFSLKNIIIQINTSSLFLPHTFSGCYSLYYLTFNPNPTLESIIDIYKILQPIATIVLPRCYGSILCSNQYNGLFENNINAIEYHNLSLINTVYVTDLSKLFKNNKLLEQITIPFITPNVNNISEMFYGCSSLKVIKFENFLLNSECNILCTDMFKYCNNLHSISCFKQSFEIIKCELPDLINMSNMTDKSKTSTMSNDINNVKYKYNWIPKINYNYPEINIDYNDVCEYSYWTFERTIEKCN